MCVCVCVCVCLGVTEREGERERERERERECITKKRIGQCITEYIAHSKITLFLIKPGKLQQLFTQLQKHVVKLFTS